MSLTTSQERRKRQVSLKCGTRLSNSLDDIV
nr:MAG TPA: hypothetical protein [Caudoviricetes sp.]